MNRRVVITGLGAITPLGNSVEEFWKGLCEGKNGIGPITRFDTEQFSVKLAAEVKHFDPEKYIPKKDVKRYDLFSQYALAASTQAIEDSGLDLEAIDPKKASVFVGSGIGGLYTLEEQIIKMHDKSPSRVGPLFIPMAITNIAAGHISIRFGFKGTCHSVVTACSCGSDCIGEAFRNIKYGHADLCLAGGAEAAITQIGIAGFTSLHALSEVNDKNRASIPFDKERKGFVMGEGAGILVLEELNHALNRKAKIYGEVIGYGSTCDAYHMTAPDPNGEGAATAMLLAMEEGGIRKEEVGYINAHGTGTPPNDSSETKAIKVAFGSLAKDLAISSTKSMTGHLLGGTGAIEAICVVKVLNEGIIPPTINYQVPDEECDLNYVPNQAIQKEVKVALSNTFGFGGHNGVICLKRYEV